MRVLGHFRFEQQARHADAAGDQADGHKDQGEENAALQQIRIHPCAQGLGLHKHMERQNNAGGDRADIALQQVGAETCNVADVIADVIGDGRGVPGVVLRDVGFRLADEVRAHISSLRVDAAADAVEHGDHGAAQGIAGERHGEGDEFQTDQVDITRLRLHRLVHPQAEDHINEEQAQQRKAADAQAHDGAAAESDLDRLADVLRLARFVRDADVGIGRDLHTDHTSAAGHDRADEQGQSRVPRRHDRHNDSDDGNDGIKNLVLIADKRIGAHADRGGDLAHLFRALGHLLDLEEVERGKRQRQHGRTDHEDHQ